MLNRALVCLLLLVLPSAAHAQLVQAPVFVSGQERYHTYRIPALLTTKNGVLLAFCEGRKESRGDTGKIDLILKRSLNGGAIWEKTQVVWHDGPNTCGNPCPVQDRDTGTIWLLMTHNLGQDTQIGIQNGTSVGSRTVWLTKSDDDGATWKRPVNITTLVKKKEWTWYATGPGVGIQTKAGRLVIPCDNYVQGSHTQQAHVIVSDDHGKSWKLGGVVGPKANESQIAELSDGSLLFNIRSYRGTHRRLTATSKDGGTTFSALAEDQALIEPICQASLIAVPSKPGTLVFSNPASTKREKMTVRLSSDDGKTWPASRVLHEGPAAYSCLTVLPNGDIGCLYEQGMKNASENITLARFPLSWLK